MTPWYLTYVSYITSGVIKDITDTQIPANLRVFAPGGGEEPRGRGLSKGNTMTIL